MQYDSFEGFFSRKDPSNEFSLQRILERHGIIPLDAEHTLSINEWRLNEPDRGPEECIFSNYSYSRELWFTFSITGPRLGEPGIQFSRCMVRLPVPIHDSEFILSSLDKQKFNHRYKYPQAVSFRPDKTSCRLV